jgi:3-deoxy-D-manno-octulosonic acid (KDO) 8-phosphate synthase
MFAIWGSIKIPAFLTRQTDVPPIPAMLYTIPVFALA